MHAICACSRLRTRVLKVPSAFSASLTHLTTVELTLTSNDTHTRALKRVMSTKMHFFTLALLLALFSKSASALTCNNCTEAAENWEACAVKSECAIPSGFCTKSGFGDGKLSERHHINDFTSQPAWSGSPMAAWRLSSSMARQLLLLDAMRSFLECAL